MASVPEFLECPLCFEVYTQVVESPCCHRCFCLPCIRDWLSKKQTCPNCRNPLSSADSCVPNIPFRRLVDELPATCVNAKSGCTDKITRGILQEHLTKCGYMMIKCEYGADKCPELLRKDFDTHKVDCIYRSIPCSQCTVLFPYHQIEKHIESECPNTIIHCSREECKATFIRTALEHHLDKECPFSLINCPFIKFGICKEKILRGELENHYKENALEHITIALNENNKLSSRVEQLEKLRVEFESGIEQLTDLKPKLPYHPLDTKNILAILPSFLVMDEPSKKIAYITGDDHNIAGVKSSSKSSLFMFSSVDRSQENINVIVTGDRPVPQISRFTNLPYYFEITVRAKEDPGVLFGFVDDTNGNNKGVLGKIPQSYALEVYNQRLFGPRISSKAYCGTRANSRTYGCGWDQKEGVIFFVVDEMCGGSAFRKVAEKNLKPAICFTCSGVEVFVNFGVSKFLWDPTKFWEPFRVLERQIHSCVDQNICTYKATGKDYFPQAMYHCKECNLETNFGMCEVCAKVCHAGHTVSHPTAAAGFFCDCGALHHDKKRNICKCLPTIK